MECLVILACSILHFFHKPHIKPTKMPKLKSRNQDILEEWLDRIKTNPEVAGCSFDIDILMQKFKEQNGISIPKNVFVKLLNNVVSRLSFVQMKSHRLHQTIQRVISFSHCQSNPIVADTTNTTIHTTTNQTPTTPPRRPTNTTHSLLITPEITPDDEANEQRVDRPSLLTNEVTLPSNPLTLLSRAAYCLEHLPQDTTNSHTIVDQPLTNFITNPHADVATYQPTSPFCSQSLSYIQSSINLDFAVSPRPDFRIFSQAPNNFINLIEPESTLSSDMKWNFITKAIKFGYERLSLKNKTILAQAIIQTECYLAGYTHPVGQPRTFYLWYSDYMKLSTGDGKESKGLVSTLFQNRRGNYKVPYSTIVQKAFPGFLHKMFRYAGSTHGYDSSTAVYTQSMNDKARAMFPLCEIRGVLHLTEYTFTTFFNENKGTLKEDVSKPRLSIANKAGRVIFCTDNRRRLRKSRRKRKRVPFYYCFLDEKWFYIFTKRKKKKCLPAGPGETSADVFVPSRKIRSRRFVSKVMFMGIIAPLTLTSNSMERFS